VAAGIARAELYGRMTTLAFEDGLTGLANRHALVERLDLALERGAEVALLLCDVDNLKALNQGRGHHGGDWALKAGGGRAADGGRGPARRAGVPQRGRRVRGPRSRRGRRDDAAG
jgi:GGDEF domain-containing protein